MGVFTFIGFWLVMTIIWFIVLSLISLLVSCFFLNNINNLIEIFPWVAYVIGGISFGFIMAYIFLLN
jgi:hypothetical protein